MIPLALGAGFAGCSKPAGSESGSPSKGPSPTAVALQLDWFVQPEYGGYFHGLEKGYFAEAGLALEIRAGGPNAAVREQVALGRAEFGMTNGDDVLVSISRGLPLVIIAAEMQTDPQGILFHASRPLQSLRDLDGRTIMAGDVSTWVQFLRRRYGINFKTVPLSGDLSAFLADESFIQQCFVTSEPYFAARQGARTGTLLISTAGYRPYRVIFTRREYLAQHPERVRAFVRAALRSWRDFVTGDPRPGLEAVGARNPSMTMEFMTFAHRALVENRLVTGDPAAGEAVGHLDRTRLAEQIRLLVELGLVERALSVDEVATFDFQNEVVAVAAGSGASVGG